METTVTASHNANKLLSLSNDLYETSNQIDHAYLGEPINLSTQRMEVGRSMGQFYGMKSVGVSENGLWLIEMQRLVRLKSLQTICCLMMTTVNI